MPSEPAPAGSRVRSTLRLRPLEALHPHLMHRGDCIIKKRPFLYRTGRVPDRPLQHGGGTLVSEMNEPRVPNLEEMDERQAHRFLTELYAVLSPEKEYELRHEDYVSWRT